jgi:hypothetical protein
VLVNMKLSFTTYNQSHRKGGGGTNIFAPELESSIVRGSPPTFIKTDFSAFKKISQI